MKKSRRKFYKLGIALMCVVTLLAINMMPQGFGFYGKATADSISKKLELKVSPEQESYKAGDEIVVKTEYKNETDGGSSEKQFVVDLKYSKDFLELKDGEEYQVVTLKKGDTAKLEYRFKVDKDISDIKDKIEVNVKEDGEISFVRQAVTRSLSKAAATAIPKLKRSNNSGVFRVVKKWSDGAEAHHDDYITVQLQRNGTDYGSPKRINKGSGWAGVFTNLPIKDGSGNSYRYRIKEKETTGYHTEYKPVTTAGSSSAPVYTQVIINDKIEINKKIDALKDNKPEDSFNKNPDTDVNGEDDYRLYLDINGGVREKPIDVLFVVDNTTSMITNQMPYEGHNHKRDWIASEILNGKGSTGKNYGSGQSKPDGLISKIMHLNKNNKVALMTFCGPEHHADKYWKRDANSFTDAIIPWSSLSQNNSVPYAEVRCKNDGGWGTNYSSALLRANEYFSKDGIRDDGNDKFMIFVSDGKPNATMIKTGNPSYLLEYQYGVYQGNGVRMYDVEGKGTMEFYADYFVANNPEVETFTIGIKKSGEGHYEKLQQMAPGNYYSAETGQELADAFDDIKSLMYPTAVEIKDDLSQYVKLNMGASDLKVERTYKENGVEKKELVWKHDGAITAGGGKIGTVVGNGNKCIDYVTYHPSNSNNTTGQIRLVFKRDYRIGKDNKFTISFNVKTSETAKKEFKKNLGTYPHEGDENTDYGKNDTSSKQPGFYSNNKAVAEYTVGSKTKVTKEYQKPVIQTKLDVDFKKIDALDGKGIPGVKFKLYKATATTDLPVTDWKKGDEIEPKVSGSDGEFSLKNIESGKRYILEETHTAPGYVMPQNAKWYIAYDSGKTGKAEGLRIYDSTGKKMDICSDITYHIKNERLYELPKAGGMGTYIFYGIGAFMAMMAIMLFRMKLGRRRGMI